MPYRIAGIDVHKKKLAVVVADLEVRGENQFERRWYGSHPEQLRALAEWLIEQQVEEVVIAYASHCTSLGRCETFSNRSRLDNLTPLAFLGGSGRRLPLPSKRRCGKPVVPSFTTTVCGIAYQVSSLAGTISFALLTTRLLTR